MAKSPGNTNHSDALLWQGRRTLLTQPCLLGRAPDNDVVITDEKTSRRHAMIYCVSGEWWLSDLGSRNGLRVNGIRPARARRLRDGDEIRIGECKLVFVSTATEKRHTTLLPGGTTQVDPKARGAAAPGAIHCELIVTSNSGDILEGGKAAQWYFGRELERQTESTHVRLPKTVRDWLERQNKKIPQGGVTLELEEKDRRLIVTLCRSSLSRFFLLVREESAHATVEQLQGIGLSPREAEVMRWVCEGKTNSEIAAILNLSVHTVNRHLEHILAKLGVENRQKAIVTVLERMKIDVGSGHG